jgi:large conductance mechanosensitive channel
MGFVDFLTERFFLDMAIGIILGLSFVNLIQALINDFITPLFAAIGGMPDFNGLFFTLNNSRFLYGHFVNALLSFLILAFVVYFLVYIQLNSLINKRKSQRIKTCYSCQSEIPIQATKCKYCCSTY